MKATNLVLRNEHARASSNFTQLTFTGQIIRHRRSLKLRFRYRNQVVTFQIRKKTFVNESSAPNRKNQIKIIMTHNYYYQSLSKIEFQWWQREKKEKETLPWFPGNLFDIGRVDDRTCGTCVWTPHSMEIDD